METVISRISWGGTAIGSTDIKYGDEWLFWVFYLVLQWINQILSNNIQNNSESIWPSNSSELDSVWDCQAGRLGEESGGWELGGQIPTTWGSDSSVTSVPPVDTELIPVFQLSAAIEELPHVQVTAVPYRPLSTQLKVNCSFQEPVGKHKTLWLSLMSQYIGLKWKRTNQKHSKNKRPLPPLLLTPIIKVFTIGFVP